MSRRTLLLILPPGTMLLAIWAAAVIVQRPPYAGVEVLSNGLVHEVVPNSPGARAGVQVGDRVTRVDGRRLHAVVSLYGGRSAGDRVVLSVRRSRAVVDIDLVLGSTTPRAYIFNLERLFVGLIFWLVGTAAWLLRPEQREAHLFFAFSQVMASMLFAEILDPTIPAATIVSDFARYLVAPLLLHFFATFPRPLANRLRRVLCRSVYAGYLGIALLFGSSLFLPLDLYPSGLWVAPRIFEVMVVVLALGVLLRPHPTASLDVRRRRRILFAGMLLGITPMMITLVSMVLSGGRPLITYEWTVPALALIPLAYGYALYDLGQADLILNRSMVYVLLTGVLLGSYALLYLAVNAVFATDRGWAPLLAGVLLVLAGSTLFVPLRTSLQRSIDRLFYGSWYDYRSFVQSVSTDLSRITDLGDLTAELRMAAETMRFQSGALLWPRGESFLPVGSFGFPRSLWLQFRLPVNGKIPNALQDGARPISQSDLLGAFSTEELSRQERALLATSQIGYWVPLVCRGTLRSILVTGPRRGDEELDREDYAILSTLSTQAAFACENIGLLQSLQTRLGEVLQVRDELAEAQARLGEGREDERRHLARELHDGPVQDLYAILHEIEAAIGNDESSRLAMRIRPFAETLRRVAETLRDICVELRPPLLEDFGLDVTIRSHVAQFREKHPEIEIKLDLLPHGESLPERVQLALFRICQEALNNAAQHARARKICVDFQADAELIALQIADDGCGFVVPKRWIEFGRRGHLGLLGIAERAESIDGRLEVFSAPGAGTTLRVETRWPEELEPVHRSSLHRSA